MIEDDLHTNGLYSQTIKGTVQRGNMQSGPEKNRRETNKNTITRIPSPIKQMKITSETFIV